MTASSRPAPMPSFRLPRVVEALIWMGAAGIGLTVHWLLGRWLGVSLLAITGDAIRVAWDKTGPTFLPLAGLSAHLSLVAVRLLLEPRASHLGAHLILIETASPALGFLGTLLGLADAMSALELTKGLENAIVTLTKGTGEAIYSSIYGVIQALVAYAVRFLYRLDEEVLR